MPRADRVVLAAVLALLVAAPSPASAQRTTSTSTSTTTTTTATTPLVVPAPVAPAPPPERGQADPLRDLGAGSPSCRFGLDGPARAACRASGSVLHDHPLSSYGLDVRAGWSVTDPGKSFSIALQSVGSALWTGLMFLLKGVLLLLEWAFALDLTAEAMPEARGTLDRLQRDAFGEPWLLMGISVAGLWGIWNGLVRMRAVETMAGLAATLALFVGALVIVTRPAQTVGWAAATTNDAALGVMAAGTTGTTADRHGALADAMRAVWVGTVHQPWCALQFGSVEHCTKTTGDRERPTVGDVWLSYPAQSWQRERLFRLTKDGNQDDDGGVLDSLDITGDDRQLDDDVARLIEKKPERIGMQEAGGTFPRLALLAMVTIGLLGAAALFAYLGLRLLLAASMTLLLLLIAPAMLIAPGFGESGRATFLVWLKRLAGAIVAKLVYAVFLTVVLAAARVFLALEIGWFGTWLVLASFWWGVFLKRNELIAFVAAGVPHRESGSMGQALSQGYYAWMLGRSAKQMATAAASPVTSTVQAMRTHHRDHQDARRTAVASGAREQLDEQTRGELTAEQDAARETVGTRRDLRGELAATNRRLAGHDEAIAAARASGARPPAPSEQQAALVAHRRRLRALVDAPAAQRDTEIVRHADRNRALTGEPVTQRDLDTRHAQRQQQVDRESRPEREEALLRGTRPDASRRDVRRAARQLGDEELRERTREEHARRRAERRASRGLRS